MEGLKKALQQKKSEAEEKAREIADLKAALSGRKEELEERGEQLQELQNILEVKSREADECMDKYCSLIVQIHKLEESNEALTTRLELLSASQHANGDGQGVQRRRSARKSVVKPREENPEVGNENSAPSTPLRSPQGSKRARGDLADKDGAQEALRKLTKKIKANAANPAKGGSEQEDEDFRPEGLPELVQRGTLAQYY